MNTLFKSIMVAGTVLLAASCGNEKKAEQKTVAADALPSVRVVEAGTKDVELVGTYTSTILPYAKNNIAPQSPNRIAKINVEIGDFVQKGQILAEMDRVQLLQTELQMKNNETEYLKDSILPIVVCPFIVT